MLEGFYTDDFMFDVMGIQELPNVLYQYTSVESFEKILSTRTMRFSRLDSVNDPEEATAADVPAASSTVFVSCWSNSATEQIPMWSMYGQGLAGVRIRLPSDMFGGRNEARVFEKGGALSTIDSWYAVERLSPAASTRGCAIIGPNMIYYSDDPAFRNRKLVHRQAGLAHVYPYDLGMVKNTHWSYEQEWRFKVSAFPFEASYPDDRYFNEVTLNLEAYPVVTQALFLPLDPSALDELEVVVGPKADAATHNDVERLLATYVPKATLVRSQIRIR